MKTLIVGLAERSYPIHVGSGLLAAAGRHIRSVGMPKKLAIVSNPKVSALYADQVLASLRGEGFTVDLLEIPDGESFKSLETYGDVMRRLIEGRYDRKSGLVALGGGVIGDLTGFVAATYLRGIPFVQIPTTLLAQVDSSVGGKTAVNHPLGKNLIGAFYQPRLVLADVDTLQTLPPRELRAGLAEVIKYGVIRDARFFVWLENHMSELQSLSLQTLVHAVERSCQIKADIVETDEKESSIRAILNFGHTFGHAVETVAGYGTFLHGEAVSIGMVVAAMMADSAGYCSSEDVRRLSRLLQAGGLPVEPPNYPLEEFLAAMGRDKKIMSGELRMIFNVGIGDCRIEPVCDLDTSLARALDSCTRAKVGGNG